MNAYSKVNTETITELLSVSQIDGVTLNSKETIIEDICDPKYEGFEFQKLYPPNVAFVTTYKNWGEHLSCAWTIHENDPSTNRDKFMNTGSEAFRHIVLSNIACIMVGDSIVLDCIAKDINNSITSIELLAMFTDQASREYVHKAMYSRMLDVSSNSEYYRSKKFCDEYMSRFKKMALKYKSSDIRIQMYFILMCENILFAPMFQTICYLASLGFAPKLCDLNLLVMRDEYLHYKNARIQSANFKRKIDTHFAREILEDFKTNTLSLCRHIIGDFNDGVYNLEHVIAHFNHVVHGFKTENDLYLTFEEFSQNEKLYGTSPAKTYMNLPKYESRINHMESNNTVYVIPGNNSFVDMDF